MADTESGGGIGELLCHLAGDYLLQSHWMATEKLTRHGPAAIHAATYAACFLPVTRAWRALAVIGGSHFVIDRWRLAKYLCWAKNQAAPARHRYPWSAAGPTGYYTGPGGVTRDYLEPRLCSLAGIPDELAEHSATFDHPLRQDRRGGWYCHPCNRRGRREIASDNPPPPISDGLASALLFLADNAGHLLINRWALRWAGRRG